MRITSIAFVLVTLVVAGCGGGNSEPAENPDQTASAPMAGDKLVGVWFGIAVLDDNKFDRKLESMVDENDKQQLRTRASTFQSTLIGAHFKPDGSLELDVEIMGVDGQKYRESVAGTWRVVEQTATEVIVETAEHRPDGEVGKKSR
ncbi:MAG: hypothetical protein GTO41_21970, partial [Burkholderiales bacterium]|nr:hypothetical protein [Burkholderiales bacterium]